LATAPVARPAARVTTVLSPSTAHCNKLVAARLAARLRAVGLHNDAATTEEVARIEIQAALDAACKRTATPPPTVPISTSMMARDVVEAPPRSAAMDTGNCRRAHRQRVVEARDGIAMTAALEVINLLALAGAVILSGWILMAAWRVR
jgi:hypothetical protein